MSDPKNALAGVVLKTPKGDTYFIPQKVLEGFRVEDPAGKTMLDQLVASAPGSSAPLQAHSVSIERSVLQTGVPKIF